MRFVDLDRLYGPADFSALIEDAEAAAAAVAGAVDDDERHRLLRGHRDCYRAFRLPFEGLIGVKCWYTESRNPGSDHDIDHFRPKARVSECEAHCGYWWLAFDWRNLRLSSQRANRLRTNPETGLTHGKGDHFPLLVEQDRWMGPADACRERPKLLDPTDPCDPPLLTFDQAGRVALAPDFDDDPEAVERLEASRLYLHLDWPEFVEDRTSLYGSIKRLIRDGDRCADDALDARVPSAVETLKTTAAALIRLTEPREPYSKAAIACIRMHRDRTWVKKIVLPHIAADGS